MTAIKAFKMTKKYNGVTVVNGIDLTIEKGELFGFLGRNGAGKSTFINMLTGIAKPTLGSFTLLDGDSSTMDVKRKVGVMPDYSTFYESTTALEHLRFFASLSGKAASNRDCMEVLEAVGLAEHVNKKVGLFSFGMKRNLVLHKLLFMILN